jgi:hypothetical protein
MENPLDGVRFQMLNVHDFPAVITFWIIGFVILKEDEMHNKLG